MRWKRGEEVLAKQRGALQAEAAGVWQPWRALCPVLGHLLCLSVKEVAQGRHEGELVSHRTQRAVSGSSCAREIRCWGHDARWLVTRAL